MYRINCWALYSNTHLMVIPSQCILSPQFPVRIMYSLPESANFTGNTFNFNGYSHISDA